MDASVIVQIFACALATLCSIGAMGIAIWTVHESRRPQPVAFLEHVRDKSCILFVIENFGTGVASNIEISGFDYALVGEGEKKNVERSFVETGIPAGPQRQKGHPSAEWGKRYEEAARRLLLCDAAL